MGIFNKKIILSKEDNIKINSLLPEKLQRIQWDAEDIIDGLLLEEVKTLLHKALHESSKLEQEVNKINKNRDSKIASKILIFNTEIHNAKPLGMVDIGIVEKFTTTSTGNRFENGAIGYAIESSFDKVWAENNAQFDSVNKAKLQLLIKTKSIYPECNMLFKFEIDFRELGASGNVFIYARGTACIGENKSINKVISEIDKELMFLNEKILEAKIKIEALGKFRKNLPTNRKELESLLSK